MEITIEALRHCHLKAITHFDGPRGPKGFSGWVYRCVEHPRLTRKIVSYRDSRPQSSTWLVDNQDVGPRLEAAVPLLNSPAGEGGAA